MLTPSWMVWSKTLRTLRLARFSSCVWQAKVWSASGMKLVMISPGMGVPMACTMKTSNVSIDRRSAWQIFTKLVATAVTGVTFLLWADGHKGWAESGSPLASKRVSGMRSQVMVFLLVSRTIRRTDALWGFAMVACKDGLRMIISYRTYHSVLHIT